MMNAIFRQGYNEYKRQSELKNSFERQAAKIGTIINPADKNNGAANAGLPPDKKEFYRKSMLLLQPLVEIAWADGRVTRREMESVIRAAEILGLVDDADNYNKLIEQFVVRPSPSAVGRMWQDFHYFMESLTLPERRIIESALLSQAEFIAEQSPDSVIGFLRGERICQAEREALQIVADQLEKARTAAEEIDRDDLSAASTGAEKEIFQVGTETVLAESKAGNQIGCFAENQPQMRIEADGGDEFDKLIPLVPLVKVAWAEGRITRRERELILAAAKNLGIQPGSVCYQRLSDWFELHPTDEFYAESLERLRGELEKLPEDERVLRRLDLLSDCINVAAVSGGTSRYPAGGAKICDEESAAVKQIAGRLNGAQRAATV